MTQPTRFHDGKVLLYGGDCLEILDELEANSVDSIVTDAPYHLTSIVKRFGGSNAAPAQHGTDGLYARASRGFMGKAWDGGDIAFRPETWAKVLRVLKPGGHLVAFAAPKCSHRMVCAIEDAGFEIRDGILNLVSQQAMQTNFFESLSLQQKDAFLRLIDSNDALGQLAWGFGQGFPKSRNVSRDLDDDRCLCELPTTASISASLTTGDILQSEMCGGGEENASGRENLRNLRVRMGSDNAVSGSQEQDVLAGMFCEGDQLEKYGSDKGGKDSVRSLRDADLSSTVAEGEISADILQLFMQGEDCDGPDSSAALSQRARGLDRQEHGILSDEDDGSTQSGMEGWRDLSPAARELREREIHSLSAGISIDGENGRLRDGASSCDGEMGQATVDADGVRSPSRPRAAEQSAHESGTVAGQSKSQDDGTWPHCDRCGKPIVPDGLGSALKPAFEPICLARKPLSESSISANVLRWKTGAINVDACRVEAAVENTARVSGVNQEIYGADDRAGMIRGGSPLRRWPANLVTDGSDEVLAGFPDTSSGDIKPYKISECAERNIDFNAGLSQKTQTRDGDSGSAARFFYQAKASSDDRLASKHPTVKPIALMRWLVRMITPPGGTVLDCFAGTGTTAHAALLEGFNAILIEREAEYQADIARRMSLVFAGEHETTMATKKQDDHALLPLFGGAA
jgi:DNA modification methylase